VRKKQLFLALLIGLILAITLPAAPGSPSQAGETYIVQPGDTWAALGLRFQVAESALRELNPHFNRARQPTIGAPIGLPAGAVERAGRLVRIDHGGLLQTAALYGRSPWELALSNGMRSPYGPTLWRPLLLPGQGTLRELPPGMAALELSPVPAAPGLALGLRGTLETTGPDVAAQLDGLPASFAVAGKRFAGVVGTGAFYAGGAPELSIRVGDGPTWIQPWAFAEREWAYQELTLTGEAAQIDQQARDEERARLREIWMRVTPDILWDDAFRTPVTEYLSITADYGARRSYNGGPYLTYHEGIDFSAYGGTPVYAPAAGVVVLAEPLYVRGGAVIIDHGLGIYTGYYHLSAIHATPGQTVAPGDLLGEVGTTGLSTGNHLHWDLLVNGVWVDAAAWQEQNTACWLREGLGQPCPAPATG
jgi:murein DD-endopeptidase MepM/ murein hydrolase activator NlpD